MRVFPEPKDGSDLAAELSSDRPIWIDLKNPTPEERAVVEGSLGAAVPSKWALGEIETSSRLQVRNSTLFMSTPSATHSSPDDPFVAPVGFVLSRKRLITVRFSDIPAFDAVAAKFDHGRKAPNNSLDVFITLGEEVVDRFADSLERASREISELSSDAFAKHTDENNDIIRISKQLRGQITQVGRIGNRLSDINDGLLGFARVVNYTEELCRGWIEGEDQGRLASLKQDMKSLLEYEEHLAGDVQFNLDALVGLINMAQNDTFKVLTIFTIVGIPPTLVASIYGMNFENMPELKWAFGYEWGWALIILSTIVPIAWFKWKGWF